MAKFKYGLTASEHKGFRPRCPKPECPGEIGQSMFSWGGYSQCHGCNRVFGWTDSRGSRVSKEQYGALVERWAGRPSRGAGMSCPAEEGVKMAKAKKAVKKAGLKAEKVAKGPRTLEDRMDSPCGYAVKMILTTSQSDEQIADAVRKEHPDAAGIYQKGIGAVRGIRNALLSNNPRFAWAKELGGSAKAPAKASDENTPAAKTPAPVTKAVAKPKAVKKPVAKKAVAKKKEEPKQ